MSAAELQAQALVAIAGLTVNARQTGDLRKYLADVEHVLSSLIVMGAVPSPLPAVGPHSPALKRVCSCNGPAHAYDPSWCRP